MVGQTLSHYRVLEMLGGGGMGVVYRAEDLKLGRQVALKLLPEDLAADRPAVERFQREARAAAAINHPSICTVYEVGDFNTTPYLALELLEGSTLKYRINNGPLPLITILDWAIQIADGLEAAHAHGIVHRDLKPANLFVTNRGQAKILDFGLAKLREKGGRALASTSDATVTALISDSGETVGTPAYMSPEQACGEQLDARTDLFSLGVVLYEMATGKLPFPGASAATVFASILRDTPEPVITLNPQLPVELGSIISKAMEKSLDLRYQSAADLQKDLLRLKRDVESGVSFRALALDRSNTISEQKRTRRTPAWVYAVSAIVVALSIGALVLTLPLAPPRVLNTTRITNDGRTKTEPFLTDGARVYFNTEVYIDPKPFQVSANGGESVRIPMEMDDTTLLDISPDHSQFLVSRGGHTSATEVPGLWITPVLGGSPRRLGDLAAFEYPATASWSPDGKQVVYSKGKELWIARSDGAELHKLVDVPGTAFFVRWSPDGNNIRFSLRPAVSVTPPALLRSLPLFTLWEVGANGAHLDRLLPDWHDTHCCGNWTQDGRYFVFEMMARGSRSIWAIRERKSFFRLYKRDPVQLTTGPMNTYGPVPSLDGKRIFVGGGQARLEILRYDRKSNQFISFLNGLSAEGLDFCRDGKWVTYATYPERSLWRSTITGDHRLQLSPPEMQVSLPRWSPDRKRIAFQASEHPGDLGTIFVVSAEGGVPRKIINQTDTTDPTWSPDGNSIAFASFPFHEHQTSSDQQIKIVDLKTGQVSVVPGSKGLWSPRWSPDGRSLLALSTDTQNLLRFDFGTRRWQELARANFGYPSWSSDSQFIYFDTVAGDPALFRLRVRDRKLERLASLKGVPRTVGAFGPWAGLGPDDSPLVARDASYEELYALDWEAP